MAGSGKSIFQKQMTIGDNKADTMPITNTYGGIDVWNIVPKRMYAL